MILRYLHFKPNASKLIKYINRNLNWQVVRKLHYIVNTRFFKPISYKLKRNILKILHSLKSPFCPWLQSSIEKCIS